MFFQRTAYSLPFAGISSPLRFLILADLHGDCADLLPLIAEEKPDALLLPGDLFDRKKSVESGLAFLRDAARLCPVFLSLGNHDVGHLCNPRVRRAVNESGATLLDNEASRFRGVLLGGLTSGSALRGRQSKWHTPPPDLSFLLRFSQEEGEKLLLCHHPEYYDGFIADLPIPLTVCGHAHGGQWAFFGQGVFAPGQGLFPRYTAGLYHGRLLLSRGLCRTRRWFCRFGNPREAVLLTLTPEK